MRLCVGQISERVDIHGAVEANLAAISPKPLALRMGILGLSAEGNIPDDKTPHKALFRDGLTCRIARVSICP